MSRLDEQDVRIRLARAMEESRDRAAMRARIAIEGNPALQPGHGAPEDL